MPFSQAAISDTRVDLDGPELFVSWATSAPGSVYQVYVDRQLAWSGRSTRCHVPLPPAAAGRNVWVDVGTVLPREATLDFSASLPVPAGLSTRASLTWLGGTYLDPTGGDDVAGFSIYGADSPGDPVDYSTPIDTVPAYPGGWISDGFGLGGFGLGGFGRVATSYQWRSGALATGVWPFAVVPFDHAGNAQRTGLIASVSIVQAPLPPAAAVDGTRLSYQYSGPGSRTVTLSWLASPSQG